ncbi:murein transglycosylase A [Aquabacterium sp.]|uniref:murein transglycosylase A n=1 Tax=Aquabacterium sp. TaxID=1872578 RepID=UPI002C58F93C|nr:MltA domain-containing protein [Aquabacterium sp.]HSW07746.1 MltA domain-containing protein [Aquabacterium sp.]
MTLFPRWIAAAILGVSAGCAMVPSPTPERPEPGTPTLPGLPPAGKESGPVIERAGARWVAVDWSDLPGWADDRAAELWPALRAGCAKPPAPWATLCARVARFTPADDGFARDFLQQELRPYRVEARDGGSQGLATGYFEPLIAASRKPQSGFTVPLHRPPTDLATRKPYWTRQQLDSLPAARQSLRGQEIAYVASPLDVLILQIQGSGRLRISEPDGSERTVRVAYGGHNDQPYRSVGRWLIEQGELRADGASWPAIRDWGQRARPERLNEMLWSNPRVVFFREEPLPEDNSGPRGAMGVPLTAGRSVAVDPGAVPYGTPLWLDTTEPLSSTPLRRLVLAQDTGTAITGAVRIDYFWGTGAAAEQQAGRMKQPLRLWALWPR